MTAAPQCFQRAENATLQTFLVDLEKFLWYSCAGIVNSQGWAIRSQIGTMVRSQGTIIRNFCAAYSGSRKEYAGQRRPGRYPHGDRERAWVTTNVLRLHINIESKQVRTKFQSNISENLQTLQTGKQNPPWHCPCQKSNEIHKLQQRNNSITNGTESSTFKRSSLPKH